MTECSRPHIYQKRKEIISINMTAAAVEIPARHKAAIYDKPGTISTKVVELETPEPGPGEVLVRL